MPAAHAHSQCAEDLHKAQFPLIFKQLHKERTETLAALQQLELQQPRRPAKAPSAAAFLDVHGFLPNLLQGEESFNSAYKHELLKELGFDLSKGKEEPRAALVVRMPRGFKLPASLLAEQTEQVNEQYDRLELKTKNTESRYRLNFVYHEGLTNAVRRRVKVKTFQL